MMQYNPSISNTAMNSMENLIAQLDPNCRLQLAQNSFHIDQEALSNLQGQQQPSPHSVLYPSSSSNTSSTTASEPHCQPSLILNSTTTTSQPFVMMNSFQSPVNNNIFMSPSFPTSTHLQQNTNPSSTNTQITINVNNFPNASSSIMAHPLTPNVQETALEKNTENSAISSVMTQLFEVAIKQQQQKLIAQQAAETTMYQPSQMTRDNSLSEQHYITPSTENLSQQQQQDVSLFSECIHELNPLQMENLTDDQMIEFFNLIMENQQGANKL
nr:unnamed protein product [Naegleria fowleri]